MSEKKKKKSTSISQSNELTYTSVSPKLVRNVKVGDLVAPTL